MKVLSLAPLFPHAEIVLRSLQSIIMLYLKVLMRYDRLVVLMYHTRQDMNVWRLPLSYVEINIKQHCAVLRNRCFAAQLSMA